MRRFRWFPGTKLGPYDVLARLGAGGMGEVYRTVPLAGEVSGRGLVLVLGGVFPCRHEPVIGMLGSCLAQPQHALLLG